MVGGYSLATGQLGPTQPDANRVLHSYLDKFGIGRPTSSRILGETGGTLVPLPLPSGSEASSATTDTAALAIIAASECTRGLRWVNAAIASISTKRI